MPLNGWVKTVLIVTVFGDRLDLEHTVMDTNVGIISGGGIFLHC